MIILTLVVAATSAPLSRSSLTDSVLLLIAAAMRGVHPLYKKEDRIIKTLTLHSQVSYHVVYCSSLI